MTWVCQDCGSDDIQEVGILPETFSLGEIVEGPDSKPMPPDGYDLEGDINWNGYAFEYYQCRSCLTQAVKLEDLVEAFTEEEDK